VGLVRRWRARHLFRTAAPVGVSRQGSLSTGGCLLRRQTVLAVGNFDARLTSVEDANLGARLLAAGHDVVFDPSLRIISTAGNTLSQVLERYWRWGGGPDGAMSLRWYMKQVAYSIKVMALRDLEAGDPFAVPISLLSPHYQYWRSRARRTK
jgi:hypothetical protein